MGGAGAGSTVLVVDDEPSIRLLCRVNLELEGYRILEAASFEEAREHLRVGGVDVVLLDVHVGRESGRDFLPELRREAPGTQVAYLSGSVDIAAGGEGADGVIHKPFQLDELTQTVARLAAASNASSAA